MVCKVGAITHAIGICYPPYRHVVLYARAPANAVLDLAPALDVMPHHDHGRRIVSKTKGFGTSYFHALEDYEGKLRPERTAVVAATAVMASVAVGHIKVVIVVTVAMVTVIGSARSVPCECSLRKAWLAVPDVPTGTGPGAGSPTSSITAFAGNRCPVKNGTVPDSTDRSDSTWYASSCINYVGDDDDESNNRSGKNRVNLEDL